MDTKGTNPMNEKKYTWKGAAIALAYFAAGLALVVLAGCGPVMPAISGADHPSLVGHAFVLKSVTVSPDVTPKAGEDVSEHCLPDSMYADMLRDQLQIAFKNAGLGKGKEPAVPVSVEITERHFSASVTSNSVHARLRIESDMQAKLVINGMGSGVGKQNFWNFVPDWRKQQRLLPTLALIITNGSQELKDGKGFKDQPYEAGGFFDANYWLTDALHIYNAHDIPKDGLHQPLTVADIERATGKSADQLAAICKANEAAAD